MCNSTGGAGFGLVYYSYFKGQNKNKIIKSGLIFIDKG